MNILDRLNADMNAVFSLEDGITEACVVENVALRCFYEYPTEDAQPGAARLATPVRAPYATLLASEVKAKLGRKLKRGDVLTVRGKAFRIRMCGDGIRHENPPCQERVIYRSPVRKSTRVPDFLRSLRGRASFPDPISLERWWKKEHFPLKNGKNGVI